MKKWIICLPILLMTLTGCQPLNQKRDVEREASTYYVDSTLRYDVNQETKGWEMLKKVAEGFQEGECDILESDLQALEIYEMNGYIRCWNWLKDITNEEMAQVSTVVGEELLDLIEEAKGLEKGGIIEKVVNNYGVCLVKSFVENHITLYITHSGLTFNDEVLQNQIEVLCKDQLLISAISRGKDKQIVELAYPIRAVKEYVSDLPPSIYYKVIMDTEGNIETIKMVISSYYSDNKVLKEEKYNHLESMLEQISGESLEMTDLKQKICQGIENRKETDGSIGSWDYEVTTKSENRSHTQITVVEFNRD